VVQGDVVTLKIIGSGLGRTGTKSLQTALNMLGLGPCHHMVEVFAHPQSIPLWIKAAAGQADWEAIFAGYESMVDYPGAAFWRELAAYYPDAKILHSVRDPEAWFDSTQATIFSPTGIAATALATGQQPAASFFMSFSAPFAAHMHDRAFMTDYFRRHTEAVKAAISPERLLVYDVGSGWEPLCRFFGVPVPDTPYPSENSRTNFVGVNHTIPPAA
jgi:hypothetical protein